ncbi:hypothetical protein GCM10009839_02760 [Catenulispora yoronensis]|uniref:DUF1707 domain-containing protein n=1 Tax=Catenulispora yoronensis TaxID=450799 RepID=A0ABP5EZF6_9ACTN
MSENQPNTPALRASDADRDRTIDVLRGAVADGRLFPAEFDERVEAALAARTHEALAALTADLGVAPVAAGAGRAVAVPAAGVVEKLTIREKHGVVRRDGRWVLPHRLVVRTAWSGVTLDLTKAVPSGPELIVELRVRGGGVEVILAPGMSVDANELAARFAGVDIARDQEDATPETLRIRLTGRIKHGGVAVRWQAQAPRTS